MRSDTGYTPESAPIDPIPPQGGSGTAPPPPRKIFPDRSAEVGDDETTKREKAMGLDIDPATGRAYESQGGFTNLGLGASGRFYNGKAVPRAVCCDGCEARVIEDQWGRGFQNCGGFDFGGQFFLCPECVMRALNALPRIKGLVAAINGGSIRSRG